MGVHKSSIKYRKKKRIYNYTTLDTLLSIKKAGGIIIMIKNLMSRQ